MRQLLLIQGPHFENHWYNILFSNLSGGKRWVNHKLDLHSLDKQERRRRHVSAALLRSPLRVPAHSQWCCWKFPNGRQAPFGSSHIHMLALCGYTTWQAPDSMWANQSRFPRKLILELSQCSQDAGNIKCKFQTGRESCQWCAGARPVHTDLQEPMAKFLRILRVSC